MSKSFIKGLQLGELLYQEAVKPLLSEHFPQVPYAAARLDQGSDVLGFDTPRSMDHHWGPRLQLFLGEADFHRYREDINEALRTSLPYEIHGYSTNFDSLDAGGIMAPVTSGPVNHVIDIQTIRGFFSTYLNIDPFHEISVIVWVTMPEQCLRTVRSGKIFHDGLDQLWPVQQLLHYYPHDVWLYILSAQWRRISQEEAFVGRCGHVEDELGSRIIATRLVHDLMQLCFLMERQYAPYSKWFGTGFAQLCCGKELHPLFNEILNAADWQAREKALSQAYSYMAKKHNKLNITDPLPTVVSKFHDRPYLVIHAENFADAIYKTIGSDEVKALPKTLGAINQYIDSTDVLSYSENCLKLRSMYSEKG